MSRKLLIMLSGFLFSVSTVFALPGFLASPPIDVFVDVKPGSCPNSPACAARSVWGGLEKAMRDYCESLSLGEIARGGSLRLVKAGTKERA